MKKVLFFLIMLLAMITTVKAGDIFDYDFAWESKSIKGSLFYSYEFKDGYLFEDYNRNAELKLSYYDYKGNLVATKEFEDLAISVVVDDYIYVETIIENDDDTYSLFLSAYNEKLELVKEEVLFDPYPGKITIFNNSTNELLALLAEAHEDAGETFLFILDGDLYTIGQKQGVDYTPDTPPEDAIVLRKYKKDLSSYEEIDVSADVIKEYMGRYYEQHPNEIEIQERLNLQNFRIFLYDIQGDKYLVYGMQSDEPPVIRLYNKKNLVWEIEPEEEPLDIKLIDNYVVASYIYEPNKSKIVFYDQKDGKVLKEIEKDTLAVSFLDTKRGFLYIDGTCEISEAPGPYNPHVTPSGYTVHQPEEINYRTCTVNREIYHIYNTVTPKITTGKGTVTVDEKQSPDDQVTFTVTPAKGYTLGTVKVIDAQGNVITFTKNTFTMPHADVTIEVEFLVENANTADIAITTVILLCILSIIVFFTQRKNIIKE